MEPQTKGFDPRIEALKTKPEGAEVVSVRLTGDELVTWNNLRRAHPKLSATELVKEALKLRYVADICSEDGTGLFLQQPGTGHLQEVLSLLGYSRASFDSACATDDQQTAPSTAPKATTTRVRKTGGAQRSKAGRKTPSSQDRRTPVMT